MNGSKKTGIYLAAYTVGASSNYFFVKDGLSYSPPPLIFMSLRYAIAGASLLIPLIALRRFKPFMNLDLFLLSLFTTLSTGFWSFGLLYIDPGTSAVLSYTMPPLFALPLSMLILGGKTWQEQHNWHHNRIFRRRNLLPLVPGKHEVDRGHPDSDQCILLGNV